MKFVIIKGFKTQAYDTVQNLFLKFFFMAIHILIDYELIILMPRLRSSAIFDTVKVKIWNTLAFVALHYSYLDHCLVGWFCLAAGRLEVISLSPVETLSTAIVFWDPS